MTYVFFQGEEARLAAWRSLGRTLARWLKRKDRLEDDIRKMRAVLLSTWRR
jgi:hypothetical protein